MPYSKLSDKYPVWPQLVQHRETWKSQTLAKLFNEDNNRCARFSVNAAGLELDYSKNHITSETLQLLTEVARQADLGGAIKRLLKGEHVNKTEDRPALHTALRHTGTPNTPEQKAVVETLAKMGKLIEAVHGGSWLGHTGKRISDVVNIGIGGSDLGPRMVTKALTPYLQSAVKVHFVANIDGAELTDTLRQLDPASTLFLVASKSFSTQETRENALSAKAWMLEAGCTQKDLAKHFVAISSRVDKAVEFGIAAENVYPIWDWVGGRYSLWSAIGMSIAFAVGMDNFNRLRAGAEAMDKHFAEAPLEKNLPVLMGLLIFWYSEFIGSSTQAILPYAHHLNLLPSYLQQLEMESNGKSVSRDGKPVDYPTGAIVWGTEGTNGQHSFHQLLHQGTSLVPTDFIATLKGHDDLKHQHRLLFANCVAQSQALLTGRNLDTSRAELKSQGFSADEIAFLAPHKVHPGNRPSNTLVMEKLTPETLGALIAAYEHKVYTLGVLLDINSFDQWGVELGKLLGTHVNIAIETTDIPGDWDSSTQRLIRRFCDANSDL
jgi:glucose-6-phosphate isomerase